MIMGWEDDIRTLSILLRIAAHNYNDPKYEEAIHALPGNNLEHLKIILLYPKTE